jgi:hypothetical protein
MSHFTSIKTQMVEKKYLLKALRDLGYAYEEGEVEVRGFLGNRTGVEIRIPIGDSRYDIGFKLTGGAYEIVADWWGIKELNQEEFQQQVTQRYAYHAARAKLEAQGFNLVNETVEENGQIRLVLRRAA